MSVILSSHNLAQLEELNYSLSTYYYALRLLDDVPDEERDSCWSRLLTVCISSMSSEISSLHTFEKCVRMEHDFNVDADEFSCDAEGSLSSE